MGRDSRIVHSTTDGDLRKARAPKLASHQPAGDSIKRGIIELQGDHREVVVEILTAEGYAPVRAGG